MITLISSLRRMLALATSVALWACDSPTPTALPGGGPGSQLTPSARTSDIVSWNAFARSLIVAAKPNQQEALRALTYMSLAQHRAVIESSTQIVSTDDPHVRASQAGAIDAASAAVLAAMFPTQASAVQDELQKAAARSAELDEEAVDYNSGKQVGANIAAKTIAAAKADNFTAVWNGTVPTGPGIWFSSVGKPPLLPLFGEVRPFFMSSGHQFRSAPPPAFNSPAFKVALAEIRKFSDTRTAEQDSIAKFWAMATGTLVAGYWNEVASQFVEQYHLDPARAAHALALMNMAAMDANIACHDTKYTFWVIRPSQADPDISTAIGLPNHPSYPSNHACLSGAAALILADVFPAQRKEMERQMLEAVESRYYAGLHYRFDGDAGLKIAGEVASLALGRDRELRGQLQIP
jgi:hypothetical protein